MCIRDSLYTVKTVLKLNGEETDENTTRIGFRTVEITAEKGLLLNGKPTFINGVCSRQDFGLTGLADVYKRQGLPGELEEAAWIDGAGLFKTFFSIAVPSSSVVFTTVTIFALVWHWNDYYLAIMYLSDNFPLAVKIYDIKNLLTVQKIWDGYPAISTKCAACFMFILPLLLVYLVLQRKFVKSIDRVGITG